MSLPVLILLSFSTLTAEALATDDSKPIEINASSASFDMDSGIYSYVGNVTAVQGSRHLNSDTLTVSRKMNVIVSIVAQGKPARMTYQETVNGPIAEGEADLITYYPQKNLIELKQHALLKSQGNIFKAEQIFYNTKTRLATSPKSSQNNTTIILPPYSEQKK